MIKGHLASVIIELHQTYSRVNTVEPQSAVADALIPGKCLVQLFKKITVLDVDQLTQAIRNLKRLS